MGNVCVYCKDLNVFLGSCRIVVKIGFCKCLLLQLDTFKRGSKLVTLPRLNRTKLTKNTFVLDKMASGSAYHAESDRRTGKMMTSTNMQIHN